MNTLSGCAPLARMIRRRLARSLDSQVTDGTAQALAEVEQFGSSPWASATFEGQRHAFVVRFDGPPTMVDAVAARFSDTVAADDIRLKGELVADVALVGTDEVQGDRGLVVRRLYFEALTVRD